MVGGRRKTPKHRSLNGFVVAEEHRCTQIKSAAIARSLSVMQSLHYGALIMTSRFVSRSLVTWMPCLKTPATSQDSSHIELLRRGPGLGDGCCQGSRVPSCSEGGCENRFFDVSVSARCWRSLPRI